ncbi:restriction endonuclease [Streptomyces sp. NPDC086766]|uniref:restriction endonuclease n=1 Tax=Streptomyces sp. NPDC086766 TaxID=3365754 RepID=UPI003803E2FF
MGRARLRLRAPRGRGEQLAAAVVGAAVGWMLLRTAAVAGQVALRAWPLTVTVLAAVVGYGVWRMAQAAGERRTRALMRARLRITLEEFDAMDDRQFEYALRDLLIRDGFHARQVGRAGDQGADVIAQHRRLGRMVIQAKHTTVAARVGSHVMYQVKGTAGPVHRADIAVVVTNGRITRDARTWGDRHQVYWVDRDRLGQWAQDGIPLPQLLRLPAGRGRRRGARLARGTATSTSAAG